mgnify:FL=1
MSGMRNKKEYQKEGTALIYDEQREIYKSQILKITDSNQGKFRNRGNKEPQGYQGEWSQEIDLMKQDVQLQLSVKNDPIPKKYGTVHIRKKGCHYRREAERCGISGLCME